MRQKIVLCSLLFVVAIGAIFLGKKVRSSEAKYISNAGQVFGTFYHITYESPRGIDLQDEVEYQLEVFGESLSTFNPKSCISRINQNDTVKLTYYLVRVIDSAKAVSQRTDGAFDITVAPLVNLWGFGFEKKAEPSKAVIDSIMQFVGYEKFGRKKWQYIKEDSRVQIDASAIAKGYGVDVVANRMEELGVKNYMVEIGGEIVAKGKNPKGNKWSIGINNPTDDMTQASNDIIRVVQLDSSAIATSGNYRNFYYKDGKKVAHTIDPRTGYPVQHSLLSATIKASTCMMADAYATACMVMGVEKSMELIESLSGVEGYFVVADENGELQEQYTSGFFEE